MYICFKLNYIYIYFTKFRIYEILKLHIFEFLLLLSCKNSKNA